jgi:hypothetical protein
MYQGKYLDLLMRHASFVNVAYRVERSVDLAKIEGITQWDNHPLSDNVQLSQKRWIHCRQISNKTRKKF